MALIKNANNYLTKGVNEAYGILSTGFSKPSQKGSNTSALGAMYDKFKKDLAQGARVAGGIYTANAAEPAVLGESNSKYDNRNANTDEETKQLQTNGPSDLNSPSKSSGSSSNQKVIDSIGKGWDDTGSEFDATSKSLNSSKNYISNLGKVRDQYIKSLDNYKAKTDTAITGNKTLIEKNQGRDLDSLAQDTRKSMDNTNVMLGVKGASGGSASRQASRAIASKAGKERAGVLTAYGDETSKQNQAAENAVQEYNIKRSQAYEWEKTARQEALDDYNEAKEALSRLKNKQSGWKAKDIEAESDKYLERLLNSLNNIQNKAKAFRDNLSAKMTEYGGLANELDVASVNVDEPAELQTPEFDENIDLNSEEDAEDWFSPNKQGKKVIKSYDALGNPIYEDEEEVVTE